MTIKRISFEMYVSSYVQQNRRVKCESSHVRYGYNNGIRVTTLLVDGSYAKLYLLVRSKKTVDQNPFPQCYDPQRQLAVKTLI